MGYNPQIEEVKFELSNIRRLLEDILNLLKPYNSNIQYFPQEDQTYLEKKIKWDKGPNDWPPGPSIT